MLRRAIVPVVVWLAAFVTLAPAPVESQNEAVTSAVPRTSWGAPDLAGIWDFRTSTPLQRPEEFGDRASLTDEEAAEFEEGAVDRLFARARAVGGSESNVELWPDRGTEMAGENRTSLIVDPPDGRVPPRTSSGQRRRETVGAFPVERNSDGPEDRSLAARCIMWTPTPLTPTFSNNNVQVFQTRDYVAIYHEMIHDARIIPLDGRPHLDERIRQLRGDSRGHWEGDTLVVETTNFTDQTTFAGSGPNLRLVERFTLTNADTLHYEYTLDDPESFTKPWTVVLPMRQTEGPVYEYACHEGNRSMTVILEVARVQERAEAERN